MSPSISRINAAVLAASSAQVSRRIQQRIAQPSRLPERFRLPSLGEAPALLATDDDLERRLAWATSTALAYAVAKKRTRQVDQLLMTPDSREEFRSLEEDEACATSGENRLCRYCALFTRLFYGRERCDDRDPPIEFVNHSAHIRTEFDPDTNIASAGIGFDPIGTPESPMQLLLPKSVALRAISLAHPLRWIDAAPDFWEQTDPAVFREARWKPEIGKKSDQVSWWHKMRSTCPSSPLYLYETVSWPLNQNIRTGVQNVMRISDLDVSHPKLCFPKPKTSDARLRAFSERKFNVSYKYALEACLSSNFGVGVERSGLDVDSGSFAGTAKPVDDITGDDLKWLKGRDIAHLGVGAAAEGIRKGLCAYHGDAHVKATVKLGDQDYRSLAEDDRWKMKAIQNRAKLLQAQWGEEFWFVSVRAKKNLRYTLPQNGPPELWSALTWTAPAFLFTFINRSLLQTPHVLLDAYIDTYKTTHPKLKSIPAAAE